VATVSGPSAGASRPRHRLWAAVRAIAALTRAGLASPQAVGAVLLYRIITFKILVTLGWIGYRPLRDHIRRAVR
jgi:hypothetical protein